MALAARQAPLRRPAAIAVHDDGHMARRLDPLPTLPRLRRRVGRGWRGGLRHFGRSRSFGHPFSPIVAVGTENLFGVIESPLRRHARACRGHPRLSCRVSASKAWMAGTSPAMTV